MYCNREVLGDVVRATRKSRHLSQEALAGGLVYVKEQ